MEEHGIGKLFPFFDTELSVSLDNLDVKVHILQI